MRVSSAQTVPNSLNLPQIHTSSVDSTNVVHTSKKNIKDHHDCRSITFGKASLFNVRAIQLYATCMELESQQAQQQVIAGVDDYA